MNVNNVVRTITIRGSSEGIEKLTGDLNKLAGAQTNVAVVSETSAKRVLSLEDAWKKQTLKLDESARSQANIARETRIADGALREGLITQSQHAERLNLISQRYAVATVQAGKFAGQTGLNRYELLNLSRQMQDVGVSLASGQSPFVVLTQQGSQILDVFQASTGSVRGFFSQAIGWAGRFVTSTAGVVTGVAGIGAAALYAASSWSSGQREIDRALAGIGQRSGATANDINQIAEASAGFSRLSVSESRTAATEFAKTGNIYGQNIKTLTGLTHGFAQTIGESSGEAAKQLAKIFSGDIVEGAEKLNALYGFLDGRTREYVRTLQNQNRQQEAIAALAAAAAPSIQRASELTGFWAKTWDTATNAASNFFDTVGKGLSKATGVGLSPQDQLERARSRLSDFEGSLQSDRAHADALSAGGVSQERIDRIIPGLKAGEAAAAKMREEVARLLNELIKAGDEVEKKRIAKIGLDADNATRALLPTIAQLEEVEKKLADINRARANPESSRGLSRFDDQAVRAAEVMSLNVRAVAEQTDRANEAALRLTQQYGTTSVEVAKTLDNLHQQVAVAGAVTGAEKLVTQERARQVQLLNEGMSARAATLIAAGERAVAEGQINAAIEEQIHNLEQQTELIKARQRGTEATVKAEQAYENAIRAGADAAVASELRMATLANERAKQNERAAAASERVAAAAAEAQRRWEAAAAALKFIPFYLLDTLGAMDKLFNSNQTGKSQFNPEGYVSKAPTPGAVIGARLYGADGVDPNTGQPTPAGMKFYFDSMLQKSGGNYNSVINSLISGGLTTRSGIGSRSTLDTNKVDLLNRAIDILPQNQQVSAIQQEIGLLSSAPTSLETSELIKQLNEKLRNLTEATQDNTAATTAMTDVLSPFYSSDPRRTYLGFRSFAGGGIMTPWGDLPVNKYDQGGIATSPQVAVFGEGRTPEAYVPVPSGRIPVEIRMPANNNEKQGQRPIQVNIVVQGNADAGTVSALKQTAYQQAQSMRRILG